MNANSVEQRHVLEIRRQNVAKFANRAWKRFPAQKFTNQNFNNVHDNKYNFHEQIWWPLAVHDHTLKYNK
jgi:hypothetical protein